MINMNIFYQRLTLDKNLINNEKFGNLDFQSNLKFIIMIQINLQVF